MASAQFYTNTKLLMDALGLPGDEKGLRARCREASKHLESVIGQFVPVTASKSYDNPGGDAHNGFEFMLDPLLAVVSITDKNGNAISSDDYELYPLNRAWENGPYLRLKTYYDVSIPAPRVGSDRKLWCFFSLERHIWRFFPLCLLFFYRIVLYWGLF